MPWVSSVAASRTPAVSRAAASRMPALSSTAAFAIVSAVVSVLLMSQDQVDRRLIYTGLLSFLRCCVLSNVSLNLSSSPSNLINRQLNNLLYFSS